jgi:hypothetical protein
MSLPANSNVIMVEISSAGTVIPGPEKAINPSRETQADPDLCPFAIFRYKYFTSFQILLHDPGKKGSQIFLK